MESILTIGADESFFGRTSVGNIYYSYYSVWPDHLTGQFIPCNV